MKKGRDVVASLLIAILILFLCLPFIPLMLWSITKLWPWPHLIPEAFSLDSWRFVFSPSGKAWEGLFNSTVVALLTLGMNLALGIPAAKGIAQKEFIGKGIVMMVLLSPLFIPFTASVMGLHTISINLHFINDYIAVSLAHVLVSLPYFFVLLLFQFRTLGKEMQEAAKSLGATSWQTFRLIELPLLLPAILVASLLTLIISFSQYIPTWIMSGGTLLTLPLIIFPYASSGNASIVAAYSLWFFVPILLFVCIYFFFIKFVVKEG